MEQLAEMMVRALKNQTDALTRLTKEAIHDKRNNYSLITMVDYQEGR